MPAEILSSTITLQQLLHGFVDAPDIPINGISTDSRNLNEGDVFFACQGASSHGLDFIAQATAANVAAIVWDTDTADTTAIANVPMIPLAGLAGKIGALANRWFDSPSDSIKVSGVTGTNGKTTVAYLIAQCLKVRGAKCGYLGTIGSGIDDIAMDGGLTTPACIDLHAQLADFRDAGARYAAIEVSSHAIEQQRIAGVHFDSAIFTNLTRDHIDYHGDMDEYGATKARLFLDSDVNHRIVNIDDEFGKKLATRCAANVVAVTSATDAVKVNDSYVYANAISTNENGSTVAVDSSWGKGEFTLGLPGAFNVANAAQVLALLLSWEVPIAEACDLLGKVAAPPGRMQRVRAAIDSELPAVYVDYSHTPASLEAALRALRAHCTGQLWCVFGCGGDRDRGKRALMGEIAARFADCVVVTNDNPRSESPARIIADILEGVSSNPQVIEDRAAAISHAVNAAGTDDIILVAGKGHEDYQIIGTKRRTFSDNQAASDALRMRLVGNS